MKKYLKMIAIVFLATIGLIACSSKPDSDYIQRLDSVSALQQLPENSIIFFGKKSCSHCQNAYPVFLNILKEENKKIYYFDFDAVSMTTDEFTQLVKQYQLSAVPTLVKIDANKQIVNSLNSDAIDDGKGTTAFKNFIKNE